MNLGQYRKFLRLKNWLSNCDSPVSYVGLSWKYQIEHRTSPYDNHKIVYRAPLQERVVAQCEDSLCDVIYISISRIEVVISPRPLIVGGAIVAVEMSREEVKNLFDPFPVPHFKHAPTGSGFWFNFLDDVVGFEEDRPKYSDKYLGLEIVQNELHVCVKVYTDINSLLAQCNCAIKMAE